MRQIKFRGQNPYNPGKFEYWWPECDKNSFEPNDFWAECKMYEQFTGLTDKNGKEIYEGDILSCEGVNYKLVRHEGGNYELHEEGSDKVFHLFLHANIVEVIGNIHKNPELLK
jgi:hypothetical protein